MLVICWLGPEVRYCAFNQWHDGLVARRLQCADGRNNVPVKLLIDRRMYAASVVYCVCQILFGEDLSSRVTPPLRHLLARMPEQIAVDHGNGVEKIGRAALANEFTPLR